MAREKSHRKYQLTINNPLEHGLPHNQIRDNLSQLTLEYWCMCDEIGEEGTPHTHVYLVAKNAIMFSTIHRLFYGAHIEPAIGTSQQNRDYILKEGKYLDSDKKETNLPETFEEWGMMPIERAAKIKDSELIYQMVKDGASIAQILERFPTAYTRIDHIKKLRETILAEEYSRINRDVTVFYVYGPSRSGKSSGVINRHGIDNIYRVTNYKHPFDDYNGQDVIVFEDYHSNIPLEEFLGYLDIYPIKLPARYANKQALFTQIYIISNLSLEEQYSLEQMTDPATYEALIKRVSVIINYGEPNDLPDEWLQKGEKC